MTEIELWDALDGLMAYDLGATDSGIHDEDLRERVQTFLQRDRTYSQVLLARFVREHLLGDDALKAGSGLADVEEFIDWLRSEMSYRV